MVNVIKVSASAEAPEGDLIGFQALDRDHRGPINSKLGRIGVLLVRSISQQELVLLSGTFLPILPNFELMGPLFFIYTGLM